MSKKDNQKITALIVDDEDLARLVLRELTQTHPEIEVVAECGNGFAVDRLNHVTRLQTRFECRSHRIDVDDQKPRRGSEL